MIFSRFIVFGGCISLLTQYFPDPKYCNFTYSIFEADNLPLRLLFGLHEFLFMLSAWGAFAVPCTICTYQGVAMSTTIDKLNETLKRLFLENMKVEKVSREGCHELLSKHDSLVKLNSKFIQRFFRMHWKNGDQEKCFKSWKRCCSHGIQY